MNFIKRNKIPLLLFLLGVLLFANTLDAQRLFSWDDQRYLDENPLVQNFMVGKIFTTPYFGTYIPVTILSFAVEHRLWGMDPAGYHAVNMIIHALNGVLVFFFLFLITGHRPAAVIGAVLFIVHPVQVESVAWISQRKNLLSMFFFLLAFISHIQSSKSNARGWLPAAWAFYLLSVLSKPAAVGAPILFMAYDYFLARLGLRRAILASLVPLSFAVFGAVAIMVTSAEVGGIKEFWGGSRWAATQLTFLVTWENIMALIWPSSLSPHYMYADEVIRGNWRVWAGLAVLLAFTGLSLRSLVKFFKDKTYQPMTLFFYLWIMAFMLPVSNIVPIAIQRSDRHLYFPSILIFLMVGLGWLWLWQRYNSETRRRVLIGAFTAVAVLFATVTHAQNQVWTDSGTLWQYHLKRFPDDDIAVNNLAWYYYRTRQYDKSIETYNRLQELNPKIFRPYVYKGLIAYEQYRFDDAIQLLRQAIPLVDEKFAESIKQQLLQAYVGALTETERNGSPEQALGYYYELVGLLPDNPSLLMDMADMLRKAGDLDGAEKAYRHVISLSNNFSPDAAHVNLANVLLERGKLDEAQTAFEESLSTQPNSPAALGMCHVLDAKGQTEKALESCYLAAVLSPNDPTWADPLADMLLRYYSPDEAFAHASEHLAKYPDILHMVGGQVYAKSGQHKKAIENYEKFASIPLLDNLGKSAIALKDFKRADEAYKRIMGFNKDVIQGIGGRCLALTGMGDMDKAEPFCRNAVLRSPGTGDYQAAYGDILAAGNDTKAAIQHYQRALDAGTDTVKPKLAAAYLDLGREAESVGLSREAISQIKRAITVDPSNMESQNALGNILLRQHRFSKALAVFDEMIALDADFAPAYANKGRAAHGLGKDELARSAYKQALAIDPTLPKALAGYCVFLHETGGDKNATDTVCAQAQQAVIGAKSDQPGEDISPGLPF